MNILLFIPGYAFILYQSVGLGVSFLHGIVILMIQVRTFFNLICVYTKKIILGLPFLLHAPESYLSRAFEFGRAFIFKWTVNWRFLGEEIFSSSLFARSLLVLHLLALLLFLKFQWIKYVLGRARDSR